MKTKIEKNYPLAEETTFKIGGPAEFFVATYCSHQLKDAVEEAKKMNVPVTILGGGSNVIVPSEGVDGLTIKLRDGNIDFLSKKNNLIKVGAGVTLPMISRFALKNRLTGLEWAMGVPGTVGGAIYGNAGAFGQWISEIIEEVEVLEGEEVKVLKRKDLKFGYRESTFKSRNLTILRASLKLESADEKKIRERVNKYLEHRNENHPVDMPCAGSIFKNPETTIDDKKLLEKYPELKTFNQRGVLSAGYLIEKTGLKGVQIGGAKISEKHANFIVNTGEANSEDVKALIRKVKEEVFERFGVGLEREVRFL